MQWVQWGHESVVTVVGGQDRRARVGGQESESKRIGVGVGVGGRKGQLSRRPVGSKDGWTGKVWKEGG